MENQREAYARINQLAVDLAKIDLLTVSAVLAGISLSKLSLSLPLVAGLVTFGYALWCCVRVYEPRSFTHGIGAEAVEEIDESARSGRNAEEHYRHLMFSYRRAILRLSTAYGAVRKTFRNALWASITALVFFGYVAVRQLLPSYPFQFDVVLLVVVSVVALWRRDKYERE
ncbi:hypothetical protein [Halorussus ruber]|uniref:hypothetical protein n=1 Tax=Halorussus ruber TaxID=1126238 RepID=UPI001091F745|nr:hypothetical protein [Halorussus ruber]